MKTLSRRQLIAGASGFVTSFAVGSHNPFSASKTPFTLGVAAGEPNEDSFVLWTRLAYEPLAPDGGGGMAGPVPVTWEVSTDAAMQRILQRGTAEADSRQAHSVHVEVRGLDAGRPYWYRFTALGAQSVIGRAITTPAAAHSTDRLRFVFASCANYELGYFSAYRHMAAEAPDLVVFLGDYIYETSIAEAHSDLTVRRHDGPTAADLPGYRNRYALYRSDVDLQALHAAAPCLMTWDDHEVENDYADAWSLDMRVSQDDFLRRRAAAYQAYYEHMPLRVRAIPNRASLRLHERFRFGDLANFDLLDGRQYRSKQPCEVPPSRQGRIAPLSCAERTDPGRSLLGLEQEQWLFDGFRRAETKWNIVAQSQLMTQLRQTTRTGEPGHWTGSWDGYPATRERVLNAMADAKLANPVVIGGDIHSFWATDLKANFNDPRSPTVATELVCTSVTSNPPPHDLFMKMLPENPHVRYFESRHRGYVAVDLHRDHLETRMRGISDRRDPNATVSTLQQFVVEDGRPGAVVPT